MSTRKTELLAAAKAQWAATEASVAGVAKGKFDTAPASGDWSAADIYRHLIDTAHKTPEGLEQVVKGLPQTALAPGDESGLKDFESLNARMLPVELNTAHGIVWMALQKLTDEDLDKTAEVGGGSFTVAQLLQLILIDHEKGHVEQARAAAGV